MIAAKIIRIIEQGERQQAGLKLPFQTLEARITSGTEVGLLRIIQQEASPQTPITLYKAGDAVWLEETVLLNSGEVATTSATAERSWIIADYNRQEPLIILSLLFAGLVIAVARWRGFWSLIALACSFLIITGISLPLIMTGWNPILVSVLTSGLILPLNFYLSHGWELKTHIAIGSTILALILTSVLAQVFIQSAHLSGMAAEETSFLMFETNNTLNFQSLILAAVIVGALGILDDVTVSQTSVVFELKKANQSFGWQELYQRGMRIGQDHISSMVNTMILVYAGAALPLLLLFYKNPKPLPEILSLEIMAEEIIKTLTGSIGLVLAAPLTTLVTALLLGTQLLKPSEKTVTKSHSHLPAH